MPAVMSESKQIARSTGTISFFTLISRITGLARDSTVAYFFGTSAAADAFYMAFTLPNLLRRFVAEGALTISFVPIFTAELKKSHTSAKELSDQAFSYLAVFLLFLTAMGIYFAPEILQLMAAGFQESPEKFSLMVYLTRLCFPYIFFVSLAALVMGILNSFKYFGSPAASPICLNVGLIAGALVSPWFHPPAVGLVAGVLVGGLFQLLIQFPDLKKIGFVPRIDFRVHPELKKLLGLMLPAAYGAAVYQVNVIVMRLFASYLPDGAISYLWYANRLFEFPMGVFTIAIATAIQPTLAGFAADKHWEQFKDTLNYGLRLNFLITLPAMMGLVLLSHPIVRILLQRGEFDPHATSATATAMMAFSVGLPFLGVVRILVPAFYSLQDSKRPVLFATVAVVVNLLLGFWWVGLWQHTGLALALSVSSIVNAFGLITYLRWKLGKLGIKKLARVLIQASVASGVMGAALWWPQYKGWWLVATSSFWLQAGELFISVVGGIFIFFLVARIVGCEEAKQAFGMFKRKLIKSGEAAEAME